MRFIRVFFVLIILLLLMPMSASSLAQESEPKEYEPWELPRLVGDFALHAELFDPKGVPLEGLKVDAVTTIRVTEEQALDRDYALYVYIDNGAVFSKQNVRLPYKLKWNFRGLSKGAHTMMLVFATKDNQKGVVRLKLMVQH